MKKEIQFWWSKVDLFWDELIKYAALVSKSNITHFILYWLVIGKIASCFPDVNALLSTDGVTLYITLAALLGGILAISYSLKIFLIQQATDKGTAGFYTTLIYENDDLSSIFLIVIIALYFLVAALYFSSGIKIEYSNAHWVAKGTIIAVAVSFWSLYQMYINTLDKINPNKRLKVFYRHAERSIRSYKASAKKIAKMFMTDPQSQSQMDDKSALQLAYRRLEYRVTGISENIEGLFDYHEKLLSGHDKRAAREVLSVICNLLISYLDARQASFSCLPQGEMAFTSDAQDFLGKHLASMVLVGRSYMEANNTEGIIETFDKLKVITIRASAVEYNTKLFHSEHPIFEQCRGYLFKLTDEAINLRHGEGMFKAQYAIKDIGLISITRFAHRQINPSIDILYKLAGANLAANQYHVWRFVILNYLQFMKAIVDFTHTNTGLSIAWSNIEEKLVSLLKAGLERQYDSLDLGVSLLIGDTITAPYNILFELVGDVDKLRQENHLGTKDIELAKMKFRETSKGYYNFLRRITDEYPSIVKHAQISIIGREIANTAILYTILTNELSWHDQQEAISRERQSIINLPYFYISNAKSILDYGTWFDSLVEGVAKAGIMAILHNQPDFTLESAKLIMDCVNEFLPLTKKHSIYKPVQYVCYMAMIFLSKNDMESFNQLKGLIEQFQRNFNEKFLKDLPKETEYYYEHPLESQLYDLRKGLTHQTDLEQQYAGILPSEIKSLMYQIITLADFDWFTWRMWNYHVANSPIEAEIAKELRLDDLESPGKA